MRGKVVKASLALQSGLGSPGISVPPTRLEGVDSPLLSGVKDPGTRRAALCLAEGLLNMRRGGRPRQAKLSAQKALMLSCCTGPKLLLEGLLRSTANKGLPAGATLVDGALTPNSPGVLPRAVYIRGHYQGAATSKRGKNVPPPARSLPSGP